MGSRTRGLIEAYGSTPHEPVEDLEADDAPALPHDGDPGVLSALEFLEACVLPLPDLKRGPPPADPQAGPTTTVADSADPAMQARAAPAVPDAAPTDRDSRLAHWRVPRGLLYWLGVGAAAGAAWRLTSSPFEIAVAALVASAALIGLELLLRLIDPRLARRLGFARARRGAAFYGASVALGVGTGLAVAHVM
jgi:hypothetical protein